MMHAMLLLVACNLLVNRTLLLLLLLLLLGLSKGKRNDDHAVNFHLYKIVELEHNKKKKGYNGREINCVYRYKSLFITI